METKLAREMEKISGTAELGRTVMEEMSDAERYAEWTVATTMNSADFLDKAAEQRGVSQAERAAREERRERYLQRMNQIADTTNIKMLLTFDRATEDVNRRTVGDDVEDAQARLADFLFGRRSLPPGSR